jgi:hypothetical protein
MKAPINNLHHKQTFVIRVDLKHGHILSLNRILQFDKQKRAY